MSEHDSHQRRVGHCWTIACRARDGRTPRAWRFIALAVPVLALGERSIPLEQISVRGSLHPAVQEIRGALSTEVSTPFGAVPVTGRVTAAYDCDGSFSGTIRYRTLVRLAARVKRLALVTRVDGQLISGISADCSFSEASLRGRFAITDGVVVGHVRINGDSLTIQGTVRTVGDDAFHAELRPMDGSDSYTALINLSPR